MEDYIKQNCRIKDGIPLLYGSRDVWPWIETTCNALRLKIDCAIDTIVKNYNRETMEVTLIQFKKQTCDDVLKQLSDVIDDTKISLPWLDTHNIYTSYENYGDVNAQLRKHKLTAHIVETADYEIKWLRSKTVKLIRFDCEVPDELKRTLKLYPNLFSVNLSFAYPWHQFWYINETHRIDRLLLDVCANQWSSAETLSTFDLIDLLQVQIAIRGSIENQYLYNRISRLIEQKINSKSSQFNINMQLFESDKVHVHDDAILFLLYEYGRHFRNITWLYDFTGTTLFDNCVRELNMKIRNDLTVEIDLKRYQDVPAAKLIQRICSYKRHFNYTLKIKDYRHFTGDFFLNLIKLERIAVIEIDVGHHLDYFMTPKNGLGPDEMSAGCGDEGKTIRLKHNPRLSLDHYNGVKDFVCFFKRAIQSEYQQTFFYLIIDGTVIEDWSIFADLNILSIRFENVELNTNDLIELGKCTNICSTLEFHDCPNLNDVMLLTLIEPGVCFSRIKITGQTSVTRLFFYMRAETRMRSTNSLEYDFADEMPVIEMDQYDHIAEAKYYRFDGSDCIECFEDYEA